MNNPKPFIKPEVQTISSEVETLRKILNDIEVLSKSLELEILQESPGILLAAEEESHSLDSLSGQISHMNQTALRIIGTLQNISKGLGTFSNTKKLEGGQ